MKQLDSLKKDLAQVAEIVNAFKSESVQVRVLQYILETGIDDTNESEESQVRDGKRTSRRTIPKLSKQSGRKGKVGRPAKKGRPGAATVLDQLLQSGFFNKKRTIAEIISHAGSKMGFHYKPNELSPPLIRFVRDGKLDRDKNAENQFEYVKK